LGHFSDLVHLKSAH